MNENTIADCTPQVNPKQRISSRPLLMPEALYSRQQIIEILGVDPRTMQKWIKSFGLEPLTPGTKRFFFTGRNVICSMRRASRNDLSRAKAKGKR